MDAFIPPSQPSYATVAPSPSPRTSALAIASLVLGIFGCIPFIPGLLALIFGVMAIRRAGDSATVGKGLAIAGLTLGIISLLCWSAMGGVGIYTFVESGPTHAVAKQFLQNVGTGNTNAVLALSSGLTQANLQSTAAAMAPWGALQSVNFNNYALHTTGITTTAHIDGAVTFATTNRRFSVELMKTSGGWKVVGYLFW